MKDVLLVLAAPLILGGIFFAGIVLACLHLLATPVLLALHVVAERRQSRMLARHCQARQPPEP